MKTQTSAIVASEVAVAAVCAGVLYTRILILAALIQSLVRIVGLI